MRASFRGIFCVPHARDSWIHHFCIVGRKTAGVNVEIGKKKMEQDNLIKNQNLFPRTTDIPQRGNIGDVHWNIGLQRNKS